MITSNQNNNTLDVTAEKDENILRTDLWHTMSLSDLYKQRDIVTQKISLTLNMMERGATDFIMQLYKNLLGAEQHITRIIELKESGESNNVKTIHSERRSTFK